MPIIPILGAILPVLIKGAESIFSGPNKAEGSVKKDFVMGVLGNMYDGSLGKIMPDLPKIDEKQLFLDTASVWIEHICRAMKE